MNHKKLMGENIPAERPTAETKKDALKNLKIEEMLAQYSAITGRLTELLVFINPYLWVLLKKDIEWHISIHYLKCPVTEEAMA